MEESVDTNQTKPLAFLPEISASVDAVPQDYDVTIEETIQIPKQEASVKEVNSTTARPITTTTSVYTTTKRNFRIKGKKLFKHDNVFEKISAFKFRRFRN